ncbi:MAG TPA: hypothetical protein VK824_08085 [Planctomycetota bacterium]|nr:hypothetical protein [Planctomycetota bacterium]
MIVADGGMIYSKTNAARAFSVVHTGSGVTANLNDVDVLDAGSTIRICGDSGVLLFGDSGIWTTPKSQTTFPLTKLDFQSATQGFAIGQEFVVLEYD